MAEKVSAEMVASILQVQVAVGDTVEPGQAVILLESMKMEIPVLTETGGKVTGISVEVGDVVQAGDLLVEIE
ncbi:biotin/lipoyl-binding carrier protein [Dietzia timorensis]|uniref:Biotinylated protein TB7.3 n=1 Tax=Dietzia timorensis TaxID=499555 RepID=A0A173LKK6_9ACTN|nr:biotin/lipoyl-binding carrier protein [Dietzia timorensis]ANI91837.1 Biotinylated protein TB7.3 [Dietzia timorensis]